MSRKTLKIPAELDFPFDMDDQAGRTAAFSGKTESRIEGEDILTLSAEENQLTISGMKSSYPPGAYAPRKFFCFKPH